MGKGAVLISSCILLISLTYAFPQPEIKVLTEPKPGEEYVYVQTSGPGARPIARKDKLQPERPFETSHKLPPSLTYILNQEAEDDDIIQTKPSKQKRSADPADIPAPAPAGAIKLDVNALLAKYKHELKTSTTEPPKSTTTKKSSRRRSSTTPVSNRRRTKKEAKEEKEPEIDELPKAEPKPEKVKVEVTSASPSLTTVANEPKKIDELDVPLVAAGSEKQRSRIQIKKAPNGQEYEYEYVYYYYDEDEEPSAKVSNAHDGPAKKQVPATSAEKTPEVNEVLPASSKQKTRGRQLGEEEVNEERLPAQTRFPPRSRNLNTTPLPEEESKPTRGRGRGRPTTEAAPTNSESDSVSDETQGNRGRTRANVRRPSLELVDNASFNTHSNTAGAEVSVASPSFPAELPAGPVRFLGATPNESVDPPEVIKPVVENVSEEKKEEPATIQPEAESATNMSPMDKVALDLYAILQGTQKLAGEDSDSSSSNESSTNASEEIEITTLEPTTEIVEETSPSTTTTTTTTTQATTTTTTTTEAVTGRGRFKGRGNRKTTHSANVSTTEASTSAEVKPKSKFARPSYGARPRPSARTTAAPVEEEVGKEEAKPVSHARPTLSRGRFGSSRTRNRSTTAAPAESSEESSTSAPVSRSGLTRPRSTFNLRTRGRSTTATPTDKTEDEGVSSEASSTTTRSRRIDTGNSVRPLRPGPRINLTRGRPGHSTTTTTTAEPIEDHVTGDDEASSNSEGSDEKESETSTAHVDNSPLGRLKNKHRVNVQARPKAAASAPVHVRRSNPLIARRRPGQSSDSSTEAPQEVSTEASAAPVVEEADENVEEQAVSSSTTTEEPKGLNKLLASRRRLVHRPTASNNN